MRSFVEGWEKDTAGLLNNLFGVSEAERTVIESDFHIQRDSEDEEPDELSLSIEARIEFPELGLAVPEFFNQMIVDDSHHAHKPVTLRLRFHPPFSFTINNQTFPKDYLDTVLLSELGDCHQVFLDHRRRFRTRVLRNVVRPRVSLHTEAFTRTMLSTCRRG